MWNIPWYWCCNCTHPVNFTSHTGNSSKGSPNSKSHSPLLAHRSLSIWWRVSALLTDLSHIPCVDMSVSVSPESVLWQDGWMDPDAVWGGQWGRLRDWCYWWGPHASRGREVSGVFHPICLNDIYFSRNVFNSWVKSWQMFSYRHCIIGNVCPLTFQRNVRDLSWGLREICKKM